MECDFDEEGDELIAQCPLPTSPENVMNKENGAYLLVKSSETDQNISSPNYFEISTNPHTLKSKVPTQGPGISPCFFFFSFFGKRM